MMLRVSMALENLEQRLSVPIKAFTLLSDQQIAEDRFNAIKNDATLKP
jgi:hypothetical protein